MRRGLLKHVPALPLSSVYKHQEAVGIPLLALP